MKKFFEQLRGLPETEKKMIFFATMGLAVIIVGYFAIQSFRGAISSISQSVQSVHIPVADISNSLAEKLPSVPPPVPTQETAPNPTETWQTYAGDGFSIKYPDQFAASEKKSANKEVALWESFSAGKSSLDVEVIKTGIGAGTWIAENFKDGAFAVPAESIKEVSVQGESAFQFNLATQTTVYHYTLVAAAENKLILIAGHELLNDPYPANLYENFVSSFTLTK